jgi:hypothetical protein
VEYIESLDQDDHLQFSVYEWSKFDIERFRDGTGRINFLISAYFNFRSSYFAETPDCDHRHSLVRLLSRSAKSGADLMLLSSDANQPSIPTHQFVVGMSWSAVRSVPENALHTSQGYLAFQTRLSFEALKLVLSFFYGSQLPIRLGQNTSLLREIWKFSVWNYIPELEAECIRLVKLYKYQHDCVVAYRAQAIALGNHRIVAALDAALCE